MSNKVFYLICLALVLAIGGFARAELLVNPGFEDDLAGWKAWGGGSGSGAGGYFFSSAYGATIMADGTAHGGEKYIEAVLVDEGQDGWWWNGMWVMQEHAVTEGKTYQISGWVRAGDADGAPTLIPNGIAISWEWRATAPVGDTATDERGDKLPDGVHNFAFDLTEEWTFISSTDVAPPGAQGLTVSFMAAVGVKYDLDDASYGLASIPIPVQNPGFEDSVLTEGSYNYEYPGWGYFGNEGEQGTWNLDTEYGGSAPEGENVGWVNPAFGSVGVPGGFAQVLTTTLTADTTYTLTVEVGNTPGYTWGGYAVQLLAGGTPGDTGEITVGTLLAEDNNTLTIAEDTFETSTVTYTYDPELHSGLLGEPLQIRLLNLGNVVSGDEYAETDFDNVTLSYVEVPRPKPVDPGTDGLLAYYALAGDVNDSSGNGIHGTIHNADTGGLGDGGSVWVDDSERGTVISFNGTADGAHVRAGEIPQMTLTNDFTWAFWAKQDADNTTPNDIIFGNRKDENAVDFVPRQFIKFTPTKFEWHMNDNGEDNLEYDDIPADVWLHHVVVKTADQLTYYRNGIEHSSGTFTQPLDVPQPLFFGGDNEGLEGENWNGLMSDVCIYDRALSDGEVLYLAGFRENLALNPSFESPDLGPGGTGQWADYVDDWIINAQGNCYLEDGSWEIVAPDGASTLKMWGGAAIWQQIGNVSPNTDYEISMFIGRGVDTSAVQVELWAGGDPSALPASYGIIGETVAATLIGGASLTPTIEVGQSELMGLSLNTGADFGPEDALWIRIESTGEAAWVDNVMVTIP